MKREPNEVRGDAPDVEGLREFARSSDRQKPPLFAGRSREIGEIRERLRYSLKKRERGETDAWTGQTSLVQGAPGAGKTALLERLAEILPCEFADSSLQICKMRSRKLGDPNHSLARLARKLHPDLWKKATSEVSRTLSGGASLSALGLSAGAQAGKTTQSRTDDVWEKFVEMTEPGGDAPPDPGEGEGDKTERLRPVLLLIDEIQNAPGDEEGPAAAFLAYMHEATDGLPVFPVYGGLAWSSRHLADLGISRTSLRYVRTLEVLTASERREAVEGFFTKFRVRGSADAKKRAADAVADECQGWPQHLHAHLQALAEGLVSDELPDKGDLDALSRAGLEAFVRERAKENREAYYEARLDSPALENRSCLAAVGSAYVGKFRCAPDIEKPQIADLGARIDEASAAAETPRLRLPDGMSGEQFAVAMVRAGLLHQGRRGALSVPIPSLTDYLERNYVVGVNANENLEAGAASASGM